MKATSLTLTIISLVLLTGVTVSSAGPVQGSLSTYSSFSDSSNLGYQSGRGGAIDLQVRAFNVGLKVYGHYSDEPKAEAETGYTFSQGVELRYYFHNFYLGAGRRHSGYKSSFADGEVWNKVSDQNLISLGYEGRHIEAGLSYSFKEYQTENSCESLNLSVNILSKFMGSWSVSVPINLGVLAYDQGGTRNYGFTRSIGFGITYSL